MNSTALLRGGLGTLIALCYLATWPATTSAQQYSVNALAYADVSFYGGSNLVSNPLNAGDNRIANLFKQVPHGSYFARWNPALRYFDATNYFSTNSGWSDASMTLIAPSGGLLWLSENRSMTFVGEPWPAMCVTYAQGLTLVGMMPRVACALCINGDCPAPISAFTSMYKWDAQNQQPQSYTYMPADFQPAGWYGQNAFFPVDPPFGAAEAAFFDAPSFFDAPYAFMAKLPSIGGTLAQHTPAPMTAWERSATNLTVALAIPSNAVYTVMSSTNLASREWQVVQQGIVAPQNESGRIVVPRLTNGSAFFRVTTSPISTNIVLFNPARTGTSFRCQMYAPNASSYTLQRTANFTNGAPWTPIVTVVAASNSIVTFSDNSASGSQAYYRVQY
jgi:hypothetical protein